jgi:hypothetical protein
MNTQVQLANVTRRYPGDGKPAAGRRRCRPWRAGALAAAVAGVALLSAACGGGSSALTASQRSAKDLAYAQCMRSHGEPAWPDPTSQGNFIISGIDLASSQYQSANNACKSLLPSGFGQLPAAQQQRAIATGLKLAKCMRAHGIPNFPDPTQNGSGVSITFPPGTGIDPNSPQVRAAQKACRAFEPRIGGPQ